MRQKLTFWDIKLIIAHAVLILGIFVCIVFAACTLSKTYEILFGDPVEIEPIYPELIK